MKFTYNTKKEAWQNTDFLITKNNDNDKFMIRLKTKVGFRFRFLVSTETLEQAKDICECIKKNAILT